MTKSTIPTNTSDCTPPRPLPMESHTSKKLRQSRESPKNETGVVLDPGGRPAPYEVGVGAGLLDTLLTDKTLTDKSRNTTLSRPNRSVEHGHHSPSAAIPPLNVIPAHSPVIPAQAGTQRGGEGLWHPRSLDGCFAQLTSFPRQLPSFPRRRESSGVGQTGKVVYLVLRQHRHRVVQRSLDGRGLEPAPGLNRG